MKLREGVIISDIDGQVMAVDSSSDIGRFNGLVRMNQTGGFVAKLLENNMSLDEIIAKMMREYEISEDIASENAKKVLDAFQNAGLLEYEK